MFKHDALYFLFFWSIILLQSCVSTYYMSTTSLYKQLSKVQDTAYAYHHKFYDAVVFTKLFDNGIDTIYCTDKKGVNWKIRIDYQAEAVLFLKTGEKERMLFKTMFLEDSVLYGQGSFVSNQKHLKFSDVVLVKIKAPEIIVPAKQR